MTKFLLVKSITSGSTIYLNIDNISYIDDSGVIVSKSPVDKYKLIDNRLKTIEEVMSAKD